MSSVIKINGRSVGRGQPAFLVAEAGFNHNGSFDLALQLVDAAAEAGADAIKFQSFTPDTLLHSSVNYRHLFEDAQLDIEAHAELAARAKERGILFASTAFDAEWVRVLDRLDVAFFKVASMDLTTPTLLEVIGRTGRPVVLSTGLASLDEVERGIGVLVRSGAKEIVLLHCVSLYPTPLAAVNLRAIHTMEDAFDFPVGFSDHTLGFEIPIWAVAAGACMIEKHFTLDRTLPGADHAQSLDPDGFRELVKGIRALETAMGSGEKKPGPDEMKLRSGTRRGVALRRKVKKGERIAVDDVIALRPIPGENGMSAERWANVTDVVALRDLPAGTLLTWSDIKAD